MFGYGLFEKRVDKVEDRDVDKGSGFKLRVVTKSIVILGIVLAIYECVC